MEIKKDYKINDIVYTVTNGSLVKTRIIKIYPSDGFGNQTYGVYSGEHYPYGKQSCDMAESVEQLLKQISIVDFTNFKA
jgi:hypothetical protein